MAKNQTRRSISVGLELYSKLKSWCEINNRSMSSVVEECIRGQLRLQQRQDASRQKQEDRERANVNRAPQQTGNVTLF